MNQRQKKRASQGKKRYHEGARRQEAQAKAPKDTQKQAESKTQPPVMKQALTNQVIPKKNNEPCEAGSVENKTFTKRKIESNWSRYEEDVGAERGSGYLHSSQSDDQLQQRLTQLLNLPTNTALSPRSQREQSLSSSIKSSNFITLDTNSLEKSIREIPLHERLSLDPNQLELAGYKTASSQFSNELNRQSKRLSETNPPPDTVNAKPVVGNLTMSSDNDVTTSGTQLRGRLERPESATSAAPTSPPGLRSGASRGSSGFGAIPRSPASPKSPNAREGTKAPIVETDELDDMLDELLA